MHFSQLLEHLKQNDIELEAIVTKLNPWSQVGFKFI